MQNTKTKFTNEEVISRIKSFNGNYTTPPQIVVVEAKPDLGRVYGDVSFLRDVGAIPLYKREDNNIKNIIMDSPLTDPLKNGISNLVIETNVVASDFVSTDKKENVASDSDLAISSSDEKKMTAVLPSTKREEEKNEIATPDTEPTTHAEDETALDDVVSIGISFYDNGTKPKPGKKKSTRFVTNIQFQIDGDTGYRDYACYFNNRARDFAATIPQDQRYDDFWVGVLEVIDGLKNSDVVFDFDPIAGKIKNGNNLVMDHTAVILYAVQGEPITADIFLDGAEVSVILDMDPRGADKCSNMKAKGKYWNPKFQVKATPNRSIRSELKKRD